jgi:Raf kinase inhibitor-like YbhB/YbcL family protein
MEMKITSPVFEEGGMIPPRYTCDGEDISPSLMWEGVPEDTESLALICDDPDAPAGTWVHWVLFNLPPDVHQLSENVSPEKILSNGARQGTNDFGRIGYGGPCPPGGTHRYYFKLYALKRKLELEAGSTKSELLASMEGRTLAESQLMGRYGR